MKKFTLPVYKDSFLKKIIFTVTNDLTYDQRMMRICGSLSAVGYDVLLTGYKLKNSFPLTTTSYRQHRLRCWFTRGKLFYAEYSVRLLFFLLSRKADCICAIDLDTMLPCYMVSKIKGIKRVCDAHEYFSQLDEVISRPAIYKFWRWLEGKLLPRFKEGYTVCKSIADVFSLAYDVQYRVIRNVPLLAQQPPVAPRARRILYQGALNKGRALDKLVEAMKDVDAELLLCGDGNFMKELQEEVKLHKVSGKVKFIGMKLPAELKEFSSSAHIAINPFEKRGLNQYLSLSNKFFDYIHAGLPQVTMNYPEYGTLNDQFEVALLIDDTTPEKISEALNKLLNDDVLYGVLKENCIKARQVLNWQNEEKELISFYYQLFHE